MKIVSAMQQRGAVPFPAFTAERVYMREFRKAEGLPADLKRWQPTVDAMLDDIDTDQPIYLMVDQRQVKAGTASRRPGVHIDGWWVAGQRAHRMPGHITKMAHGMPGGSGHSSQPSYGGHNSRPEGHRSKPEPRSPRDPHRAPRRRAADVSDWNTGPTWSRDFDLGPEGLILASDVQGCRAFSGVYDGSLIGEGGECSRIDLSTLDELPMLAGHAYAGNVLTVHESLPVVRDSLRTVVRLNVKGWDIQ